MGYRELAARLREAVIRGDYPPGSTLPRQDDLAAEHHVNVKTVRQAVAVLAAEGLVTPVRRRGTVVRPRPPARRLGTQRYARSRWQAGTVAFAADREASGQPWQPSDQTNTVRTVPADPDTAAALRLQPGDPVVERARVIHLDGSPTHTLTSYYRPADVEDSAITDPTPGPAGAGGGFAVLAARGLDPQRISEVLTARMPTPEERHTLRLPDGEPVAVLQRTTYTTGDRPIEYAHGVHAASRFTFAYDFPVPD
jgi:GntR family transcriptional regulator